MVAILQVFLYYAIPIKFSKLNLVRVSRESKIYCGRLERICLKFLFVVPRINNLKKGIYDLLCKDLKANKRSCERIQGF